MQPTYTRRQWGPLAAGIALSALAGRNAVAQTSTTRLLVGFPVGGTADGVARALAAAMSRYLQQTAIVDSKPGASGQLAAQAVKLSPGDGLNLLLTPTSVLTLTPLLYRKPMYDGLQDFTPVSGLCEHGFGLAVNEKSPLRSVADWVRDARQRTVSYGTPGAGSGPHLLGTLLAQEAKLQLNHIAYRGVAPGIQDLMGGQIDACIHPLPSLLSLHKTGKLRILATTLPKRSPQLDNVPTFKELGYRQLELMERYALFASTKTPPALVAELRHKVQDMLTKPEMLDMAKNLDLELQGQGDQDALQRDERAHWKRIVEASGITLES